MMNDKRMPGAPIWARRPDSTFKSLAEMSDEERDQAQKLSEVRIFVGKGKCVDQVKTFIEEQQFKAEERLANGGDTNEDGTDFA